jgi:hypothetical protein
MLEVGECMEGLSLFSELIEADLVARLFRAYFDTDC